MLAISSGPDAACTRSHLITFLYRTYANRSADKAPVTSPQPPVHPA